MLTDKTYNILKYVALVAIPAVLVFWYAISQAWGLPYVTQVAATIAAVDLFIGMLTGVSSVAYAQQLAGITPTNNAADAIRSVVNKNATIADATTDNGDTKTTSDTSTSK